MTPLEIAAVGAAGVAIGHAWARSNMVKFIGSREFQAELRKQLDTAFHGGMMCAADLTTMMGQEEAAGQVRHISEMMRASNENSPR